MNKHFNTIIEKYSQAILNQLKDDFVNEGDVEIHCFVPTANYRSDSIICTDLVIGKIVQSLSNDVRSKMYILIIILNFTFLKDGESLSIYRESILKKIGIRQVLHSATNINELIFTIKQEIASGNMCYIEAKANCIPYNLYYKSKLIEEVSHEIIVNGYNDQKECLIGYDNSLSYSFRLFDEISNNSQFFRLYYDKEMISKICKRENELYYFTSFAKDNEEVSLRSLLKDLPLGSSSFLSSIIKNLINGNNYSINFLKMVAIGNYQILFLELENYVSDTSIVEFEDYKNSALNFRSRAFNKILKYKLLGDRGRISLKNDLEKLSNDVAIKDTELRKKIMDFIA